MDVIMGNIKCILVYMTMIASCFSKAENSLEGTTENDETLDFIYKYMLKENRCFVNLLYFSKRQK